MDPHLWHYDGYDLTIRLSNKYRFHYLPEPLIEHRIHEKGCSQAILEPKDKLFEMQKIYQKNKGLLCRLSPADLDYVKNQFIFNYSY